MMQPTSPKSTQERIGTASHYQRVTLDQINSEKRSIVSQQGNRGRKIKIIEEKHDNDFVNVEQLDNDDPRYNLFGYLKETKFGQTGQKAKRIVYTAKRLNFTNGNLDIKGMEKELQQYAYKHAVEDEPVSPGINADIFRMQEQNAEQTVEPLSPVLKQKQELKSSTLSDLNKNGKALNRVRLAFSRSTTPHKTQISQGSQNKFVTATPVFKEGQSLTSYGLRIGENNSLKSIQLAPDFHAQDAAADAQSKGSRTKVQVNQAHDTVPKVFNHLMDKPDTISDLDFLKEDLYSSPKFMYNPVTAQEQMQMRFVDSDEKDPIKRSHVGNKQAFVAFEQSLQKKEKEHMAEEKKNQVKQRNKACSKVVVLRKKLSSSRGSRFGLAESFFKAEAKQTAQDSIEEVEPNSDLNTREVTNETIDGGHGSNDFAELQGSKKINLCVPAINTETLNNLGLNQEITFRESTGNSISNRQDNYLELAGNKNKGAQMFSNQNQRGRYFGSRTQSLNPDRARSVRERLAQHEDTWGKNIDYFHKRRVTEEGQIQGEPLIARQVKARPKLLEENDSYLELEQIYSRTVGITESEKRQIYCRSINSSRTPGGGGGRNPFSPLSSFTMMSNTGYDNTFGRSSKTPMGRVGAQDKTISFWQNSEMQKQPRKREDLQKRIAAYYQSIRNNNSFYQPTVSKNEHVNLWSVTPVPQAHRHQSKRPSVVDIERQNATKTEMGKTKKNLSPVKMFEGLDQAESRFSDASRLDQFAETIKTKHEDDDMPEAIVKRRQQRAQEKEEAFKKLMDNQYEVTFKAKRPSTQTNLKTRRTSEQFVPSIARLIKHKKIGFGHSPR